MLNVECWMLDVGCWKSFLPAQPGISGIEHSTFNIQYSTFKLENGRCCDISLARRAAHGSSVSSVSSCAILLSDFLNRRQRRVSNGGIGDPHFGHTHTSVKEGAEALRGAPPFPPFAPVQFFSLRF